MPEVHNWQGGEAQIAHAVDLLTQGRWVALPTDTTYVVLANALLPDTIVQFPANDLGWTIPVTGITAARAWVAELSALAQRFARRCWPGPLTLVLDLPRDQGTATQLPDAVRTMLCGDGTVALTAPGHEAMRSLLRVLPFPVVAATPVVAGQPATTAAEVGQALGDLAALIYDDGPTQFAQSATRLRVQAERWSVVGDGVLSQSVLQQLVPSLIVFVCTGNTCRSPLAEGLCKKLLAERFGCTVQDLPQRGYVVMSAGLAASRGEPATFEAVAVAQAHGIDLQQHESQPLSLDLLASADHVITMTRGHLRALSAHVGDGGAVPRLLLGDELDVPDPIGGPEEVYRVCAEQILQGLKACLPQLEQL